MPGISYSSIVECVPLAPLVARASTGTGFSMSSTRGCGVVAGGRHARSPIDGFPGSSADQITDPAHCHPRKQEESARPSIEPWTRRGGSLTVLVPYTSRSCKVLYTSRSYYITLMYSSAIHPRI